MTPPPQSPSQAPPLASPSTPRSAPNRRAPVAARWLVFGAAAFWGTSATLARHVFRDLAAPPLMVVELRLLIACALLGTWLTLRDRRLLVVRREDWGYLLILGVLGVATVQATYYTSIARLGVGTAILLQYLAPSLIVLYQIARRRRVAPSTLASVALAALGTALLVRVTSDATRHASPLDWAIGFSSAAWFAFYVLYSKRGLERYAPSTVLFYTFLIAALIWAFVHPPWTIIARHDPPGTWLLFLALGTLSTLVPFSLFYAGLKRLPAAEAGVLATLEPVVAVISAWVFLGERLQSTQWAGAALILAASLLASRGAPPTSEAGQLA